MNITFKTFIGLFFMFGHRGSRPEVLKFASIVRHKIYLSLMMPAQISVHMLHPWQQHPLKLLEKSKKKYSGR